MERPLRFRNHLPLAILVMAVCVIFYLWREYALAGAFGFPLDDSWIHSQFARNLALGRGMSFNPGTPVSGSTAPLWTLLTATAYLITGEAVLAAKATGILFFALSVFFVYVLVREICSDLRQALFAAVVTASLPRLIWASLSGMEVTLAVTLSLAGLLMHILYSGSDDRRQYASSIIFGLATLARPECAVFFAASMLDRMLAAVFIRWRDMATREWLVPAFLHVAIFLGVIAPFLIFSKTVGVGLLPNTAYAKALLWNRGLLAAVATNSLPEIVRSFTVRPFDYVASFLHESLNNNIVLSLFAGMGFLKLVFSVPYREGNRCRSFIIPLSIVLFPVAIGVFVPFGTASYQEGRYAAPLAPLFIITGTVGIYAASRYAAWLFSEAKSLGRPARVVWERSLLWFLMTLVLFTQGRNIWNHADIYAQEVGNIEQMQVATGRWVATNIPKDAVVATNDLGAVAYFGEREVIDTVGLISPEVLGYLRRSPSRDEAVFEFLALKRPDYAILFPSWYPEMVKKRPYFEPIHSVTLTDNLIAGGDEFVVYRMNWDAPATPESEADAPPELDAGAALVRDVDVAPGGQGARGVGER